MVLFNYSTKELTAKVVYYGPGLCGKTTNLQYIHSNLPGNVKGKMLSLATKTDRTLFFDFLPIDLGNIRGMKTRVQLYTVPGQVFYNETRKLVLKGADGIVFVADSQKQMIGANVESFKNLEENLKAHGMTLAEMPHVIQFNKRDLPKLATIEELNASINKYNSPFYESVAPTGIGVQDTLKAITKLVLMHLTKKYDPKATAAAAAAKTTAMPTPEIARPVAVAATQVPAGQGIPLSATEVGSIGAPAAPPQAQTIVASAAAEPVAPAQETPAFDSAEIDSLVDEVEEAPAQVEEEAAPSFEIDESAVAFETPPATAAATPQDEADPGETMMLQLDHDIDPSAQSPQAPAGDDFAGLVDPAPDPGSDPDAPSVVDQLAALEEQAEIIAPAAEPNESSEEQVDNVEQPVVSLTEVASDDDLFDDPSIEVARFDPGQQQTIEIPIQVGADGSHRRFKLTLQLRFDPVD